MNGNSKSQRDSVSKLIVAKSAVARRHFLVVGSFKISPRKGLPLIVVRFPNLCMCS